MLNLISRVLLGFRGLAVGTFSGSIKIGSIFSASVGGGAFVITADVIIALAFFAIAIAIAIVFVICLFFWRSKKK